MSRTAALAASRARNASSLSEHISAIESPRSSTSVTPGRAASVARSAPGSVARILREPTIALISVGGPSATISPVAISTTRSAYASASSR